MNKVNKDSLLLPAGVRKIRKSVQSFCNISSLGTAPYIPYVHITLISAILYTVNYLCDMSFDKFIYLEKGYKMRS